jgi:hypothetical protein
MTSLGFHYFPDELHFRAVDLNAWLPELHALGAGWLTLVGSLTRAIPESFIRGLTQAGIAPIVHIPVSPIRPLDPVALRPLLESYERWGVKHVVVFSEPNARTSWSPGDWAKTALVERFLDTLIPILQAQMEAGLQPTFPALKTGGDYWDTAFLEAALAGMVRRGHDTLLHQLTFAVNLWTFNRPIDWGAGGLKNWPEVRPYQTPSGSQDQRGFRVFDWYNEIIAARVQDTRPLICLAGGPRPGDNLDPAFPETDDGRHTSCTLEIVHAMASNALPLNLLNVSLWLLAAPEESPFARDAWYRGDGTTLAVVEALKNRISAAAKSTPVPSGMAHSGAGPKTGARPIRHYLLLPTFEWGVSEWHWNAALEFVRNTRPTCGFSPDEARQAEAVTILGNEQGVSHETELALRQAGCRVERIRVARDM